MSKFFAALLIMLEHSM